MSLNQAQTVTAYAGESLDALVWRVLGRGPGAVETILRANRGLAEIAEALPEGHQVIIPIEADAETAPSAEKLIQLWS